MAMARAEAKAILLHIKMNINALANCKGPHDFQPIDVGNERVMAFNRKKRCALCSGELNELDVLWYERGLQHGRNERK